MVIGYAFAYFYHCFPGKCPKHFSSSGEVCRGSKKFVRQVSNVANFTNHYNKKLDRCFIRVTFYGKNHSEYLVQLCDVFEGTVIGAFSSIGDGIGHVGNKTCKSMDEFEALIKPYMEE